MDTSLYPEGRIGAATASTAAVGSPRKAKVVVVGAGVAGLTAAVKLVSNDIKDVLVLEAQDYVGGRIMSQTVGETRLDMGAMFIHGELGNPVYEIVTRLGKLRRARETMPPYFYTANQMRLPGKEMEELFDYIEEQLDNGHDPQVGQARQPFVYAHYDQFLRDHHIVTDHEKKEVYDAAFGWYAFYDMVNEGVDSLDDVSEWVLAKHYRNLEGHQENLIEGGYCTLVRALERLIPKGILHTRMPVQKINWANPKDGSILVECANGDIITTDHVIVTISLGCLKEVHASMFTPGLPSPMVNSMDRLEMGTIGKIFLKWNTPFWTKDNTHFDFLWLNSKPVTPKNDRTKRKTSLGKLWWQYIPGLQTISESDNILVVWLQQHQLDAISDVDDQEIVTILFELMQVFLYDLNVTRPDDIVRTRWKENPFIRGAYVYPTREFDSSDIKHINFPVFPSQKDPRLMFAGEAFTMEYMTNVHGAFITGEHQAQSILNANGVENTTSVVDVICKSC